MARVHHGFTFQDAINACLFARKGITGPGHDSQVLAAPREYLRMAHWETEPMVITRELGVEWLFQNADMKPYTYTSGRVLTLQSAG